MNVDLSPLGRFLEGLAAGGAAPRHYLFQLAVLAFAFGAGWLVARLICKRVTVNPRWKFGAGDFERVVFPFFAVVLVWPGKQALGRLQPVALLDIAIALLLAWLLIRVAVYVLGVVLPHGTALRTVVRGFAWVAWIVVALHVIGLLPEVVEALDSIGFTAGKSQQRVTLLLVIQGLVALVVTLTIAMWIGRVAESRVLAADTMEMSTRIVITKVVNAAAVFAAILIALPMTGIDITALSVFSGALGVGLGFGLQKIASNYVSGFIVLLDRSLRIGDVITVDNRRGVVKAIETRYTVIRAGDGTESIIPNDTMITQSVVHHTYSDAKVSVVIPVSVAYSTDVERACVLLGDLAKRHAAVLDDPKPTARIRNLGDNGVEMELSVWIGDPAKGELDLRSEILKDILRTFAEAGIEIPYPRRDVRVLATPETQESISGSKT